MTEDMVGEGLVQSLARPGGNTTGVSLLSPELDGKRQEFLIEAVPRLRKLAILADANVTKPAHLRQLDEAARGHGVEPLVRGVAKRADVITAIKEVKAWGAQGINFLATPMFSGADSGHLPGARVCRQRWPHRVRGQCSGPLPPGSRLCRSDFTR
jgi:putative ABC transport system substrate-binding protein